LKYKASKNLGNKGVVRHPKKRTDQQQFGRKLKDRQFADPSAKLKEIQS